MYDGVRLLNANMTRLFEDVQTIEQWREKGFYPVLDDRELDRSVLARMLEQK